MIAVSVPMCGSALMTFSNSGSAIAPAIEPASA